MFNEAEIKRRFLLFPVAINNYYGDPTIQQENTLFKVERLAEEGHLGPVAIITRGSFSKESILRFRRVSEHLPGLVFIISYSGLSEPYEKIPLQKTLSGATSLKENGLRVIFNVRPLFPGVNGTHEALEKIFADVSGTGARHVIVSGFRGNDEMICALPLKERLMWNLRVKLLSQEILRSVSELSQKHGLFLHKRVSCGVANILGLDHSWNPYANSPQLVGCDACPINESCRKYYDNLDLNEDVEHFLRAVGYDIEVRREPKERCTVTPENRLNCPSCCTACFVCKGTKVYIKNKITLADTAFVRFLSGGIIGTQHNIRDCGGDTGRSLVLQKAVGRPVHFVNSWMVWSRQLNRCYGCSYCITQAYDINEIENGSSPYMLYQEIMHKIVSQGYAYAAA